MLFLVVALLGAVEQEQDARPTTTVSPVTVAPTPPARPVSATIDNSGDEDRGKGDFVAIWPSTAYQAGVDGVVTLACKVDVHGLAERCQVASETPTGKGLAKAALELRATFKLTPAKDPNGTPVSAMMSIKVRFKAPKKFVAPPNGPQGVPTRRDANYSDYILGMKGAYGNPLAMRAVTMLDDPVWVRAPTFDDLARAYPASAGEVEGYAAAHCHVLRTGELGDCQIIKESPGDLGFGKAALNLTAKFRLAANVLAKAPNSTPVWVDIPIRLPPPSAATDRTVMAPEWLTGIDSGATFKLFPPEAVAQGFTTGRGVARCSIGHDGALTDCVAEPGDPDGLGFSEAAAKLASSMKMNLWSADGAPVEGGVVHIPIRLNLKSGG